MKSGSKQGFKVDDFGGFGLGEMDVDNRPTFEERVESLKKTVAAKAAAPAC